MFARKRFSFSLINRALLGVGTRLWIALAAVSPIASATYAAGTPVEVPPEVQSVLRSEADGKVTDRAAELKVLRDSQPAVPEAFWHSGWINWRKNWISREAIADDATYLAATLGYRTERAKLVGDANADIKLAAWCRQNNLPEQERAHWLRVLEIDSNHATARSRLGHEQIDGWWYTPEEIRFAREQAQKVKQGLIKWMPPLKVLIADSKSQDLKRRGEAVRKLALLDDPEAIPALEVSALQVDGNLAAQLVHAIAKYRTPEASAALSRIALTDAYGEAGDVARQALRKLPVEYYVPDLLRMLSSPISQQFMLYETGIGMLAARQLLFREVKDRAEIRQLESAIKIDQVSRVTNVRHTFRVRRGNTDVRGHTDVRVLGKSVRRTPPSPFVAQAARTFLVQEVGDQVARVDAANAQIEETDQRIFAILSDATGAQLPANPNAWWQWWYDQCELYVPNQKPITASYQNQSFVIPLVKDSGRMTSMVVPLANGSGQIRTVKLYSCLVAGTLVRTADGLRAVDQIQPGDLVLAQRIQSGELAYKPVLHTTVRPPAAIVRIETENDKIRATGGHLFWVAGRGWTRTRQLEPGMLLHTVTGTSTIENITPEDDLQPAYNLVIPDFHTYFVGHDEVLSYDNTPLKPTAQKVPGL